MFNINYLQILKTQSTTGNCGDMMAEITRQLNEIEGVSLELDDYGNLYVTKGKSETYPCFVSHTDTVHKIHDHFSVVESPGGYLYAFSEDGGKFQQVGVGGDDKCGIIACLELLTRLPKVKCVFFLDEEQGCKGSSVGKLEFFEDCRYAIQIDRQGGDDIITTGSGTVLCSDEFKEFMDTLGKTYSYKSTTGRNTDVVKLKERGMAISACNLSAGYYNPHTKQEYINKAELINCINFCVAISRIKTVYPHKHVIKTYTSSNYVSNRPSGEKCISCKSVVFSGEGPICNACIRDQLTLVIKKDSMEIAIPYSNTYCKKCNILLPAYSIIEYCDTCNKCIICNAVLETESDHYYQECSNHWDTGESFEFCHKIDCFNKLQESVELQEGYCMNCLCDVPTCAMLDCGADLINELEIINGLCSECVNNFNG